jgi:glutamyl-tRNA reductase
MRTFGKMPELSESQKALLQELVHRILGKILHNPSERLRFLSGNQKGQPAIHLARILFGLDPLDSLSPDADSIDNDKVSQK